MGKVPSGGRHPFRAGLSPRLKRLVANPKRLSTVSLWTALEPDERAAAAKAYLGADTGGRMQLDKIVAGARNFRPATVKKWPEEKIVKAARHIPLQDPEVAANLLTCYHVPGQLDMVAAFLDALGVSHDQGQIDARATIDAEKEVARSAIRGMVEEHGPRKSAVYLLALISSGTVASETGGAWLQELIDAQSPEADGETGESRLTEAGPAEHHTEGEHVDEDQLEEDDPTRQPSFTTLDRLLILAAVDAAQGIEGALNEDQLDDVVDELVTLNGRRHQSYFHAGFRNVLFDKPVREELPAENPSRLRWYWTGAVQGWARRERWDCIVREHATNPVVRELGNGSSAASVVAVRHIVEALRREGRTSEIAKLVKVRAIVQQPRLFRMMLEAATELLGKGDAASALPLFELLMKTRTELEKRGVSPTERLLLDAHRRMAHCLRHLHQHARARRLLRDLLKQDPDPNIHAMVHADLGLMVGGFDVLEEVLLPLRREELGGVVDRLAKGVEHFRDSVGIETAYSAHGHYCLGVLALARAVEDHKFEDAEHHLQCTRAHFSEAADSYSSNLVEHGNLYFGIAKALQLSSNKLAHAADVITSSLASGARMPSYLIDQTVEALGLAEEKGDLKRVTEAIIETGGNPDLDELAKCQAALDHCPALADKLAERAEADGRSATNRAADLRSALRGYRHRGDWRAVGEVLDRLERLAKDDVAVPEFLELLEDRASYDLAWDLEDATIARARCHEDRGEFPEAVNVLRQDLFYRLATTERDAGLNDAAGILERIRGYGIDPDYYSGMTSRYNGLLQAAEAEAPAEPDRSGSVRVLVVGGGEKQAKAEDVVHARLKEEHPHIRARFIQSGWSGNWSRPFSEMEREMKNHDALVIIRFMRTHLGRGIRRSWDGVWRSCWGSGPGAIVEAVARAAAAVR